jgi:hypothetical protein
MNALVLACYFVAGHVSADCAAMRTEAEDYLAKSHQSCAAVVYIAWAGPRETVRCRGYDGKALDYVSDAELSPAAEMMANASLFAEAIQSVGHVCDRVEAVYRDDAPGINYYHVTCTGQLRYTVGVSKARVVVWAGNFTNY